MVATIILYTYYVRFCGGTWSADPLEQCALLPSSDFATSNIILLCYCLQSQSSLLLRNYKQLQTCHYEQLTEIRVYSYGVHTMVVSIRIHKVYTPLLNPFSLLRREVPMLRSATRGSIATDMSTISHGIRSLNTCS